MIYYVANQHGSKLVSAKSLKQAIQRGKQFLGHVRVVRLATKAEIEEAELDARLMLLYSN